MSTQPPYSQPPSGPYPAYGQQPSPPYGPPPGYGGPSAAVLVVIISAIALAVAGGAVAIVLILGDDDDSADDDPASQVTGEPEPTVEPEPTGEPVPTDEPRGEPEPTEGSVLGTGYAYTLPSDWSDVSAEAGDRADTAAAAGAALQGSPANVVVTVQSANGAPDPGALRAEWESNIAAEAGVTPQIIIGPQVGGKLTSAVELERVNEAGTPIIQVYYLSVHNGQAYNITFSTTTTAEAETRPAFDELVSSWTWQ